MNPTDAVRMRSAIRQAVRAAAEDEPPIGAVIVHEGKIIGRGRNRRERFQDVTRHAEIEAIRQASRRLDSWRLTDCDLYVTLEPCVMCAGAIVQARIRTVVFGAYDPKAGAAGSVIDVFSLRLNHQVEVRGGVLETECALLLKDYFKNRRLRDKAQGTRAQRKQDALRMLRHTRQAESDKKTI